MDYMTCGICYESKFQLEFINTSSECAHEFCKLCMLGYIQTAMVFKQYYDLKCPFPECSVRNIDLAAETILSKPDFEEFNKGKYNAILSLDPSIRWCPFPDCQGYSQIADSKFLNCNTCFNNFCGECLQVWEQGHKCSRHNDFYIFIQNLGAKPCPGCKNLVEKKSGCTTMTCRCGTIFCMTCGLIIDKKHDSFSCLLGLKKPSFFIIFGLIFSPITFLFYLAWYLHRISVFDIKNEEGLSIYNWKNILGYALLFIFSPLLTLLLFIMIPGIIIFSPPDPHSVNSCLPKGKWFWLVKPLVWVIVYIIILVLGLIACEIIKISLWVQGFILLFRKIFNKNNSFH
jgi:E3 ubiquitin-protein ligase RNF144